MLRALFNPTRETEMKANVGGVDRGLRIVAGLVILSLFFFVEGPHRWWALIGFVPLLTGLMGWCPAYGIFGIRTCRSR
jgi:hypothetical protein